MGERTLALQDVHVLILESPEPVNLVPYIEKGLCRSEYIKDPEMGEIIQ